jgi:anti-anti-sigma regulatory factor
MPATTNTTFLVNTSDGPIVLRIQGKANYLNCAPIGLFFERMIAEGYRQFVVDFAECTGMDSTFLGLLASAGLQLQETNPPGSLVLVRLGERNLELVQNVGLHNLMVIEDTVPNINLHSVQPLKEDPDREKELAANSQMVLKAHEALIEVDESNKGKFQDVVSFLRKQLDE